MEPIKSRANERFKALIEAKKDKNLLMLEGRRLVEDALMRSYVPLLSAVTPDYVRLHGAPPFDYALITEELFFKISGTNNPQGIAVFINRPYRTLKDLLLHDRLLILDGLQDPGNVGTIIRTAEAFGFNGIAITPGTVSPFSDKALRSSMGSLLGLDIAHADSEDLSSIDHRLLYLTLMGSEPIKKEMFRGRFAICLGQEGSGISPEILSLGGKKVYIPMRGRTESLNVAVAAGIVLAMAAGTGW